MLTEFQPTTRIALVWGGIIILAGLLWWKGDAAAMGLVATIVGALLAAAVSYTNEWRRDGKQIRTSRMSIANHLRHWLSAVLDMIYDMRNFESSEGHAGKLHSSLPPLRFESDLRDVAVLDTDTSQQLFELIHEKDSANSEVAFTADVIGHEEAVDVLRVRSAELFLTALAIYKGTCAKVEWRTDAFSADAEGTMHEEITRHQKAKAKQTELRMKIMEEAEMSSPSPSQ